MDALFSLGLVFVVAGLIRMHIYIYMYRKIKQKEGVKTEEVGISVLEQYEPYNWNYLPETEISVLETE